MQNQLLNSTANIGVISTIITKTALRSSWITVGVCVASTHILKVITSHVFATGTCATLGARPTTAVGNSVGRTDGVAQSP